MKIQVRDIHKAFNCMREETGYSLAEDGPKKEFLLRTLDNFETWLIETLKAQDRVKRAERDLELDKS